MSLSFSIRTELVVKVSILDFLVLRERIQSGLSDRDHLLDDVPEDTLTERCSGQGAGISPSAVIVDVVNELSEIDELGDAHLAVIINHLSEESIVEIIDDLEVLIRDDFEEESKDTVGELGSTLLVGSEIWLNGVNDVELHIQEFAVD